MFCPQCDFPFLIPSDPLVPPGDEATEEEDGGVGRLDPT
jgi:hypothetical protein